MRGAVNDRLKFQPFVAAVPTGARPIRIRAAAVPMPWTARQALGTLRCAGCGNVHDVAGLQHDIRFRRAFSPKPGVHVRYDPGRGSVGVGPRYDDGTQIRAV